MSTEESRTIVRNLMDRLDQRDLPGVLSYSSPDSRWHGFAPGPLDVEGYRQAISVFLDAFPDSRFPVENLVAEGNLVAAHHSLLGTHLAPFQGIPATGKRVTVPAIATFRLEKGQVVEVWLSADLLGLLMQLGAIPAPA